MDFGDYVRAFRRDKGKQICVGIAVCRLPGGIGVLAMGDNPDGVGTLHCCRRRDSRVIDIYDAEDSYIHPASVVRFDGVPVENAITRYVACKFLLSRW